MKTVDFSETIAACDLKVGRCRQLIKIMKICEAKPKKCLFGIAYPWFHLVGRSVGQHFLFFKYLLFAHDRNGKKKNLRFGKKTF